MTYPNARDCEHGRQRGKCPECDLMEAEKQIAKLELENGQLKQHIEDHVTDANNEAREIVRLRGIVEQAKSYCEKYIEWLNYKEVIEILNEAGKGEGNLIGGMRDD
jgi:hypothetical protein